MVSVCAIPRKTEPYLIQDEPGAGIGHAGGLTIKVNNKAGMSLDEIRAFLNGSDGVHVEGQQRDEIYAQ